MKRARRHCAALSAVLVLSLFAGSCAGGQGQNLGVPGLRPQENLLSALEMQTGCPGLKVTMDAHLAEVKKSEAEMAVELKKPAPTLQRMMQRSSGAEGGGTLAFDKIKLERRVIAALRDRMRDKHCPE